MKTIAVIGNMGVGKSAFLNMLAGRELFHEDCTADSVTKEAAVKEAQFMGNDIQIRLVDTQGLQEQSSLDTRNIANMVELFKYIGHIDLFVLCLDGGNPRYTDYIESTITTFKRIFGDDYLNHAVLVFTKWNAGSYTEVRKQKLEKEYQNKFRQAHNFQNDIPCFFVDSHYDKQCFITVDDNGNEKIGYQSEGLKRRTYNQMVAFKMYLTSKSSFFNAREAKAVLSKGDQMNANMKKVEDEKTRIAAEKEQIVNESLQKFKAYEHKLDKEREEKRSAQNEAKQIEMTRERERREHEKEIEQQKIQLQRDNEQQQKQWVLERQQIQNEQKLREMQLISEQEKERNKLELERQQIKHENEQKKRELEQQLAAQQNQKKEKGIFGQILDPFVNAVDAIVEVPVAIVKAPIDLIGKAFK